jgi:hypothetical protein
MSEQIAAVETLKSLIQENRALLAKSRAVVSQMQQCIDQVQAGGESQTSENLDLHRSHSAHPGDVQVAA